MEYAETRGATGGVPQEERVPKVYLTVPTEPYVREVAKRDGTTFNEVKVPAHAEIGGKPLGNGWVFNPLFVDESRYSSAMSVIPLLADRDVRLHRDVLLYDRRENRLKPALERASRRSRPPLSGQRGRARRPARRRPRRRSGACPSRRPTSIRPSIAQGGQHPAWRA